MHSQNDERHTHTLHLCSQCDAHPETSGSDTDFHMKNMHGQKQDNRICKQLIEWMIVMTEKNSSLRHWPIFSSALLLSLDEGVDQ